MSSPQIIQDYHYLDESLQKPSYPRARKVDAPKKYIGKRAYVIILKE